MYSSPKEFKRLVGKIIEDDSQYDPMPDYAFDLDTDNEVMTVRPKKDAHFVSFYKSHVTR